MTEVDLASVGQLTTATRLPDKRGRFRTKLQSGSQGWVAVWLCTRQRVGLHFGRAPMHPCPHAAGPIMCDTAASTESIDRVLEAAKMGENHDVYRCATLL